MARGLILIGCLLAALGALLHFAPGALSWLGRLPGDIRIATGRTRIFIPITTMVAISIVLTILFNIFRR